MCLVLQTTYASDQHLLARAMLPSGGTIGTKTRASVKGLPMVVARTMEITSKQKRDVSKCVVDPPATRADLKFI